MPIYEGLIVQMRKPTPEELAECAVNCMPTDQPGVILKTLPPFISDDFNPEVAADRIRYSYCREQNVNEAGYPTIRVMLRPWQPRR